MGVDCVFVLVFFFSSRRRHTRCGRDWSSDVCSSDLRDAYVCRETIYNAIYALPVGELRKELIICLRQGKTTRRPRSGRSEERRVGKECRSRWSAHHYRKKAAAF